MSRAGQEGTKNEAMTSLPTSDTASSRPKYTGQNRGRTFKLALSSVNQGRCRLLPARPGSVKTNKLDFVQQFCAAQDRHQASRHAFLLRGRVTPPLARITAQWVTCVVSSRAAGLTF